MEVQTIKTKTVEAGLMSTKAVEENHLCLIEALEIEKKE